MPTVFVFDLGCLRVLVTLTCQHRLQMCADRLGAKMASLNAKGYGVAPALGIPPGFVKDPNSSWYVNSTTGMYYDVNSKSYLHSATGKYYYLDVATNSLKEWASAAVPSVPSAAAAEADKFFEVLDNSYINSCYDCFVPHHCRRK